MEIRKYFTWRPATPDDFMKCIIVPNDYDTFPMNTKNGGSYNIAPARVFGISYATYLRFVRELFPDDVTIEGKGSEFPICYWKRGQKLYDWVKFLNSKLTLAMKIIEENENAEQRNEE